MTRDRAAGARGFILPTSLLVLTLLTVMLTAAFILVSAEFRTTENAASSVRALALAEAGLANYLSQTRGLRPVDTGDSVRITLPGGYADVVASRIRAATGSQLSLWTLRSTGYPLDPVLSGTPSSRRTVARVAQLYPGILPGRAAMTALNGVQITGTSTTGNPINGEDVGGNQGTCVDPGGAAADSFGLSVAGGYSQSAGNYPDGEGTNGMETFGSVSALYDSTHINWVMLTDTTAVNFTPDYELPSGSLPAYGGSAYPVGYAKGDLTIPPSTMGSNWAILAGIRGVLVVRGNLTLADRAHWDGVIVVGGRVIVLGQYVIHGMIITGLNTQLPGGAGSVPPNAIPRTSTTPPTFGATHAFQWYYCYVKLGAEALSGMVPVRRAWTDGWALY